jgi:hypothetical protein
VNDWWSFILRPNGRDALGELLAKHPEAADRTKRLTTELTVMKLIKIANAEYNYCRIGRDIPADLELAARSEMAWKILDFKTRTIAMRPGTAWMRTRRPACRRIGRGSGENVRPSDQPPDRRLRATHHGTVQSDD